MSDKIFNGFNNGRSPSDGVGGRMPDYQTDKLVTMTEQQKKADELVERFRKYAKIGTDSPVTGRTENAIQCAIICVEEMIQVSLPACEYGENHDYPKGTEFLESVLNELKSKL